MPFAVSHSTKDGNVGSSGQCSTAYAMSSSPVARSNASCAWIASRSPISPASTASSYSGHDGSPNTVSRSSATSLEHAVPSKSTSTAAIGSIAEGYLRDSGRGRCRGADRARVRGGRTAAPRERGGRGGAGDRRPPARVRERSRSARELGARDLGAGGSGRGVHGRRGGVPRTRSSARRRHRGGAAPLGGSRDPGGGAHAALRVAGHGGRRRRASGRPCSPTASAWSRSPIERGAAAIARVEQDGFGSEPEIAERFYAAASYGGDGARSFVAWDGDEPVGMAAAYLHAGAIGIFGVAVVPAARRRGIAAALVGHRRASVPGRPGVAPHERRAGPVRLRAARVPRGREWEVWVRSD